MIVKIEQKGQNDRKVRRIGKVAKYIFNFLSFYSNLATLQVLGHMKAVESDDLAHLLVAHLVYTHRGQKYLNIALVLQDE